MRRRTGQASEAAAVLTRSTGPAVWVLRDGKPVRVAVTAGLDDDTYTEIVKGELKVGDLAITAEQRTNNNGTSGGAAPADVTRPKASESIMAEPIIRLEHVTRTYHVGDVDVHALRDVSARRSNAGEFVAIMGSSGSGKSTLMAMLGCLDRPSSGRYFFEGADVAGLERARAGAAAQRTARLRVPELQSACRAPARSRTWRCRCSMPRPGRPAPPRASSGRARRSSCSA